MDVMDEGRRGTAAVAAEVMDGAVESKLDIANTSMGIKDGDGKSHRSKKSITTPHQSST
jgi:hypothetical protein